MASKDSVVKFLSGGAPVILFVEELTGPDASSVFRGDRPVATFSLTDFIPGWQLFSCCNDFMLTTSTTCDLNTALLVSNSGLHTESEDGEEVDISSMIDEAGDYNYNSLLTLPLKCVLLKENPRATYDPEMPGYEEFADRLSRYGMSDLIDINSPNCYMYIVDLLNAVKSSSVDKKEMTLSMFSTVFDYKQFTQKLGVDDLKSQHESNSEFIGYSLKEYSVGRPRISSDLAVVSFDMSLIFSKPNDIDTMNEYTSFI